MSVTVAESAGFCFGVSRAVETVERAAGEGKRVVTLGPIIHNRHVVAEFEKLGVRVIERPEEAQPGTTVVIRSHGVPKAVAEALERQGAEVIDATCPFVKRIHGIVAKAEQEGRLPVIIGTRSHPEVEGIPAGAAAAGSLKRRRSWKIGRVSPIFHRICPSVWSVRPLPRKYHGKKASKSQKNSLLT